MISRRRFIGCSLAASGVAIGSTGAGITRYPENVVDAVVVDTGFSPSKDFAKNFGWSSKFYFFSDDLEDLWYDKLAVDLEKGKIILSGVTKESDRFFLSQLARTYDYKIVYQVSHWKTDAKKLVNSAIEHQEAERVQDNSFRHVDYWLAETASEITRLSREHFPGQNRLNVLDKDRLTVSSAPQDQASLTAWVLSPICS